jgi:hypothetical protein
MSSYTVYDFSESLDRAGISERSVDSVIAAWGDSTEGYGQWEGGFLMKMKDDRYAYVWGWCDTSGWGCQDGAEVEYYDEKPPLEVKRGTPQHFLGYMEVLSGGNPEKWNQDWDENPIDLNRYLQGEIDKW